MSIRVRVRLAGDCELAKVDTAGHVAQRGRSRGAAGVDLVERPICPEHDAPRRGRDRQPSLACGAVHLRFGHALTQRIVENSAAVKEQAGLAIDEVLHLGGLRGEPREEADKQQARAVP